MKLRNKKTGEIGYPYAQNWKTLVVTVVDKDGVQLAEYNSLNELNEEWEDYEEPKEHWEILAMGAVMKMKDEEDEIFRNQGQREIGNYFNTREEAEKAVEKLKAWKRLKDNGLVIKKWRHTPDMHLTTGSFLKIEGFIPAIMKNIKDLDLLFGGEE